jgi:hypothetical protein
MRDPPSGEPKVTGADAERLLGRGERVPKAERFQDQQRSIFELCSRKKVVRGGNLKFQATFAWRCHE